MHVKPVIVSSDVVGGVNTSPRSFEVVPKGTKFYGFIVDWVCAGGCALRYGNAPGLSFDLKDGVRFLHTAAATEGLWFTVSNDWIASAAQTDPAGRVSVPFARILVFYEPAGVEVADIGSIWDRGQSFQLECEVTSAGGNKALVLLNHYSQLQQAGVAAALFKSGPYGRRLARVNSLLIESSATGRVRLIWTGAGAGANNVNNQPAQTVETPLPLGFTNLAGGLRVTGGNDPGLSSAQLLAHPIVTAGQDTGLSDLDWRIHEGWALAIADDTAATTLFVSANVTVAKLNPDDA